MKLDKKQQVPLTSDELDTVRTLARNSGITPGLFSRALFLYALDHISDPAVTAALGDAKAAAAQRLSAGGREAVAQRWGR